MGKSYKRWEETGIYTDTYELVKSVHSVIYDFPKKDRVVIGDKMIDKATSMIAFSGMAYKKEGRIFKAHARNPQTSCRNQCSAQ